MNVGAKGGSGDAQPHPRALCHTLGNPVPVSAKLGPGGQVVWFFGCVIRQRDEMPVERGHV